MTATVITLVVLVVVGAAAYVLWQRNQQARIEQSDQLRQQAATEARGSIAPAQERAALAEADAEEARVEADRAEDVAREARLEAQQVEAAHEAQVREADRVDPRVDHRSDDYEPQVAGTADHQPTPPSEVNVAPAEPAAAEPAADEPAERPAVEPAEQPAEQPAAGAASTPLLPRRTPGAQDMPGKPIEQTDGGGGWFTKKAPGADGS